jgi:hypothetical protein
MENVMKRHKWFLGAGVVALLAGLLVAIAMFKPSATKAATADMPAFVYPPVTVHPGQHLVVCGSDMGEITISGVIGLLDVTDTSTTLAKIPFTLKPNTGSCTTLPAVQRGEGARGGERPSVIAFVAFPPDTQWNSTSGKAYVGSLQVTEGTVTKFALAPMFLPAVPIPQ